MPRPNYPTQLIGPSAKPKVRYSGCAFQPGTLELDRDEFIPLDSPAWFAWLEQKLAFRSTQVYYGAGPFRSEPVYLSDTVRPERGQQQLYWYPYKKYHNRRLAGMYLGKTENVTLTHLDQLALQFLAQIDSTFYAQMCQFGLVRCRKVPQPAQNSPLSKY